MLVTELLRLFTFMMEALTYETRCSKRGFMMSDFSSREGSVGPVITVPLVRFVCPDLITRMHCVCVSALK
jgi:hypothetical protein